MPDIDIQFHAAPEEILILAQEVVDRFNLQVTLLDFFPFKAIAVEPGRVRQVSWSAPITKRRLMFTLGKANLEVSDSLEFDDRNPDALRLNIGRQLEKGLEQSWLTCRTNNSEAFAIWKKVAKMLKDRTSAGVTAVNLNTGATSPMRTFRYSPGAKELESQGVVILGPAGHPLIKFEMERPIKAKDQE